MKQRLALALLDRYDNFSWEEEHAETFKLMFWNSVDILRKKIVIWRADLAFLISSFVSSGKKLALKLFEITLKWWWKLYPVLIQNESFYPQAKKILIAFLIHSYFPLIFNVLFFLGDEVYIFKNNEPLW